MTNDEQATRVIEIVDAVKPHLVGLPPAVQSAVIAELLALWLAGHHPNVRQVAFENHLGLVHKLTAHNALVMPWGR